ncbi:MAG: DUF3445 domain-containing protein [Caulobacterales bacterium]
MRRPPYLPFLEGPPDFVVGLRPIPLGNWLAPDVEADWLPEKRALLRDRTTEVFAQTPGSEAAQKEAAALVGAARTLLEAASLVSDDLCIMQERDGVWTLTAAALCAPSFWSLAENIGGPLAHLHGPVPDRLGADGTQGLAQRIGRMFSALQPDTILERFNWTIQASAARFTPDGGPLRARAATARAEDALDLLHVRVERQTIRKLPQTGAVLFTIRVSTDPLRAVFAVDGAKQALARGWREAPEHVRAYKKWAAYEPLMQAALN